MMMVSAKKIDGKAGVGRSVVQRQGTCSFRVDDQQGLSENGLLKRDLS